MWSATGARLRGVPVVVTAADLKAAGVDPDVARRACAAGAWSPVLPGAWLRGPGPATRRHVQQAALSLAGPGAVLTGADACTALQLRDVPDDPRVSVLVGPQCRRRLGPAVRLLATGRPVEVVTVAGLRIAAPARAVVDAARLCTGLRDARALVTAAVGDGWCSPQDLRLELDRGRRNGSALARAAVDAAAAGCRSAPEAEVADAVAAAVRRRRLPPYVLNAEIWLDGRRLGATDGWLPGIGVGWEVDSRRHHGGVDDLDATLLRHAGFQRAGLVLVHITPARFRRDPAAFVDALCAEAARRTVLACTEPPGLVVVERHRR